MQPVWCIAGEHPTTTADVRPETPVQNQTTKEHVYVTMYPAGIEAAVDWPVAITLVTATCAPCTRLRTLIEEHDQVYRIINTKRRLKAVTGR